MGADIGDEQEAINILKALPAEARGYLSHHLRNSLANIASGVLAKDFKAIEEVALHIESDLERIGC